MIFSDDTKILSYNKLFDVLNFDAICDMGRSSSLLSKKLAYWESSYFGYLNEVKWVYVDTCLILLTNLNWFN